MVRITFKLDNTLQGRWREAPISDHFDHFPHEYNYWGTFLYFCRKQKMEKTFFCSKKGVQKGVQFRWIPIRKSQFVKVFFQNLDLTSDKLSRRIWPCPGRLYPSQKSRFSRTRFSIFTEADLTHSETLVPFAKIIFFPYARTPDGRTFGFQGSRMGISASRKNWFLNL